MREPELPTFDLVLATVARTTELATFLDSLADQTYSRFRLIVVDQNEDDRVARVLAGRDLDVFHLRSERGLSRARNAGLRRAEADIVAFPDDDCLYPPDLLERVARSLADRTRAGVTGRSVDQGGRSSRSWKTDAALLTDDNLWNRAISYTTFLRREVVAAVGSFDEQLGLGASTPWSSGEEIEYLVRAVRSGARIEYDPDLTVTHEETPFSRPALRALGYRDGASVGYILRKHRYPARVLARMFVRPIGGVVVALARGNRASAGFHAATLRGRMSGYRSASLSNSSR